MPLPVYPVQKTAERGHDHEVCPRCGAEQCGGLLMDWGKKYAPDDPKSYAEAYGWPHKLCGSTVIGIELAYGHPRHYDGVSFFRYPCCGLVVDRFTREECLDDGS